MSKIFRVPSSLLNADPAAQRTTQTRTRRARASWHGGFREGSGSVQSETLAVSANYSLHARWEPSSHASPEELLASAHASCFTMALAAMLSAAGTPATTLETRAEVTLVYEDSTSTITEIHLDVEGDVAHLDQATFARHAQLAKTTCPMSRALVGGPVVKIRAILSSVFPGD